jgi:signal transduction histidine kinase
VEIRRKRRNGAPVDLSLFAAPLSGADRRVNGILSMLVDVTERRELEQRLAQSQKMESVGQLAGGVAHDFNNLLTAILGNCEMTLGDLPPADPRRSGIEDIRVAAVHAAALTRQLLAFSRRQILQPKVLNLNAAVRETLEMLGRLIGEDIELATELQTDLGNTRADPVEVGQVIMNLSVNARDAMPDGGKLTIRTANLDLELDTAGHDDAIEPGRYVVLSISDSGTGIDEHTREKIFEPFFTTKDKGKGTGLGLSTVYGIVKQSGGHISLESRADIGTTFKIYLPRVEEAVDVDEPSQAAVSKGGPETILLVEDEESLRRPISKLLGRQGYTVLVARDGRQALEICQAYDGAIDLMVTDLVMPGMSGLELGERVADLRPEMKVLYTSGYSDAAIGNNRVLAADLEFIQKPYTAAELDRRIRELLGR